MKPSFLTPTFTTIEEFEASGYDGPLIMLYMLRFNETADYSGNPDIAPKYPVSGESAYDTYMQATAPLLKKHKGELIAGGRSFPFLIGPKEEQWDKILLMKQASFSDFMAMVTDPDYQLTIGHRHAALQDSRLLPIKADFLNI